MTIKHFGKYDDVLPGEEHIYGRETKPSDHVNEIL